MKRTVTIVLTLTGAALTLGGCCRLNGMDAAASYCCCASAPATMDALPTSFSRQGSIQGRHGWYDQNNVFHEGDTPAFPTTASNRGYYDANGGWRSIDHLAGRLGTGYYDNYGYWHNSGGGQYELLP